MHINRPVGDSLLMDELRSLSKLLDGWRRAVNGRQPEIVGSLNAELAIIRLDTHIHQRSHAPFFQCPPATEADLSAEKDIVRDMRQAAERCEPSMIASPR